MIEDTKPSVERFRAKATDAGYTIVIEGVQTPPFEDKELQNKLDPLVVNKILRFNPHLIILDLALDKDSKTGLRTLKKLKSATALKHYPVVVWSISITSSPEGQAAARFAMELGAADALPKSPLPDPSQFFQHAIPPA